MFHSGQTAGTGIFRVDGLRQLWDKPQQQCLHDKVPSTLVIKLDT